MSENTVVEPEEALEPEIVVEEAPKAVVGADEGVDNLKRQLAEEKTRREAAERQAQEAAIAAHRANADKDDTDLHLLNNAIESIKGQTASLKGAYAQAMSSGDYSRAADVQLEMANCQARLLQLETGRQAMSERPKTPAPVLDPVEAIAGQLTPRSAAWVRAHSEYATDPRLYRKMVRAHGDAIDDGLIADTDEYFAGVESRLGFKSSSHDDDGDDGTEYAAKPVSRRSSPAAAPVSRSAPSSSGNPRVIRLSAEEQERARLSDMTDREFFDQKQRMLRDQRYN